MAKGPMPTPDQLRQLLRYEPSTGKLYWRERGPEWFEDGYRPAEGNAANWNSQFAGKEALTASHSHGYRHGVILDTKMYAHRVAWAIYHGRWPEHSLDHVNGDPTDNRIENLRDVPQKLNCRNTSRSRRNTSGVTGVTWHDQRQKWTAQITIDGVTKHLGLFADLSDATKARRAAEASGGFGPNHGTSRD